jgi:hypothetical protein
MLTMGLVAFPPLRPLLANMKSCAMERCETNWGTVPSRISDQNRQAKDSFRVTGCGIVFREIDYRWSLEIVGQRLGR